MGKCNVSAGCLSLWDVEEVFHADWQAVEWTYVLSFSSKVVIALLCSLQSLLIRKLRAAIDLSRCLASSRSSLRKWN